MIYAAKILADGQLPLATAVIYMARADSFISTIKYVNRNGAIAGVNLSVKSKSGSARNIFPRDMSLGPHYLSETDEPFTIQAGDAIEGDSTLADVDFTILGGFVP